MCNARSCLDAKLLVRHYFFMSTSGARTRSSRNAPDPPPLPLTDSEARDLKAAVERIIRAAEANGLTREPLEKKKSARR